jgi:glyoxylase-like metal-dependent hydrolase (beta-lactamase superfamily II)
MSTLVPVAPGVLVATSRVMATTTTLVVHGSRGLLVDPAWRADELVALADDLDALAVGVTAGVATHAHHDHLLWHPRFGDGPRWASPATVRAAQADRARLVADLLADPGDPFPPAVLDVFAQVTALPGLPERGTGAAPLPEPFGPDGPAEDVELVVHDAHAPGHTAVWLPARHTLLVGDLLSDVELPLPFDPDDLDGYLAGLDALAPYVARAGVLVPGHGMPTYEPRARLDADRRYLDAVLAGREPDDPRLARPGMAAAHARIRVLAASRRP